MQPHEVAPGAGTPVTYDADWRIVLGERAAGRGLAIVTYTTQAGAEPPMHVHPSEDEVFYVVRGELTFVAADKRFLVAQGGFMVLPAGIPHTYQIAEQQQVELVVMTYPVASYPNGWGGFVADMEAVATDRVDVPHEENPAQ